MGTGLEDDFTPEEKELLKREAKWRIDQQRKRESLQWWRTGAVVAVGGVVEIVFGIFKASSPLASVIIAAGVMTVIIGLLLWWFWR